MFTELYREEKREEGDKGGQEDKGGNQKERDRSVISNRTASNQFPKCSPPSGTPREVYRVTCRREEGGGVRSDPNEMRWNQNRSEQASQ